MTDVMVIAVILVLVAAAARYVIKAKKSGVKCIGCPVEGCSGHGKGKKSSHGCHCHREDR